MKKILFFLLFFPLLASAQFNFTHSQDGDFETISSHLFSDLNFNQLETNLFSDKAPPFANLRVFNGAISDSNIVDNFSWWRIFTKLKFSEVDHLNSTLPNEVEIKNTIEGLNPESGSPILFLLVDYETFKDNVGDENIIGYDEEAGKFIALNEEIFFETRRTIALAPSKILYEGLSQNFVLPSNLFISNIHQQIVSIDIDFNDGNGFVAVNFDELINVEFESEGAKIFQYIITLDDNTLLYAHSEINVSYIPIGSSNFSTTITATKPYLGEYGQAKIDVIYACGNSMIRKPLIILEGIDHPQLPLIGASNSTYVNMVDKLKESALIENMINEDGYDLIFVDYMHGADYIERNAFMVEEVIKWVNQQKTLSGSNSPNVLVGLSMGGQVGRFALRDMEINSLNHDTRLFISFDSPHLGANVPVGVQALTDHAWFVMNGMSSIPDDFEAKKQIKIAYDMQHNPASRQMLIYQPYYPNNPLPSLFDDFQSKLNTMGMPQLCRNVSVVNGSDVGQNQFNINSGDKILDITADGIMLAPNIVTKIYTMMFKAMFGVEFNVDLDVWTIPNSQATWRKLYDGRYELKTLWVTTWSSNYIMEAPSFALPLDNAPGGYFNIADIAASATGIPGFWKYIDKFSFIPSISSLSLVSPERLNLNYNLSSANILTKTPFVNFKAQPPYIVENVNYYNREHVDVNIDNEDFLKYELKANVYESLGTIITNSTYNFTAQTFDRIKTDLTIGNYGVLAVNNNVISGFPNSNLTNPAANSISNVYTNGGTCGSVNIEVQNGGSIKLGDQTNSLIGNLILSKNVRLTLKSGSTLLVNNNSKLIIEEGAEIIIESGAVVNLNGLNAVLQIEGKLIIPNGVTFSKIGLGFIKFKGTNSESLKLGVNSKFLYNGTGLNDKIIQVVGGTVNVTTESGSEFNVSNANINFIAGILNIKSNLVLNSVKVNGGGDGLLVSGNNSLSVNNCEFSGSNYGIKVDYTNPNGSAIEILNSTFTSHSYGIHIYGRAFNISGCSFTYLTNSITAQHYSDNSTIESCYITGFTEKGIALLGSNFTVNMNNIFITPDENYTNYGLDIRECKATLTCSNIQAEKIPIFLGLNTTLDMSQQNGGDYGNNYIAINQYSNLGVTNQAVIKIESATNLFMDYGYNAIKKPSTLNHYIHGGTLNFQNDIYARYNYWYPSYSSGNTMPSKLINFATSGTNVFFSPIVPSGVNQPSCNNNNIMSRISDPCTDPNGCPEDQNLLNNCSECNSVKFKGKSINLVLRKIIKEIKSDTLNLNTINQIMSLDSLMNVSFIGNKPKVDLIKDRVLHLLLNQYSLINNNISYASVKPSILIKLTSTLNSRLARAINKDDTSRILQIHLIKAHLFLSENLHNQAINQFDNALNYVELNSEAYQTIQMQKCLVNIENLYENGLINDSVKMEMIISCENMQTISSRSSQIQNSTTQLPTLVTRYIKINPNPANDWLNVEFVNFYNNEAEITVYDLIGRIVLEKKLSLQGDGNNESTQLDISNLMQGTYIVKIKSNDFVKMHKQIVD